MKKVLILTYDFPPYVSVGGLRPFSWSKYLYEFDVYPIIVTRQWNNKYGNHLDYIAPSESNQIIEEISEKGLVIRTPYFLNISNRLMLKYGEKKYKFLRKFFSAFYEFVQWIFPVGPKYQLFCAANDYLKTNKVDLIIATGDPFILFKYASELSRKYNIPWVADYRDTWTQNKNNRHNKIIRNFNSFFEKKELKNAVAIVTVSKLLEVRITELIKNKTFYLLPNGYDPEVVENTNFIKQKNKILRIAYVGTIYKWHPLRSFFEIISEFLLNNKDTNVHINFYGVNNASGINELINCDFPHLKQNVFIFSKIPNNLLLQELAKNNLMLLFNDYSIIGTKIYDYLAIKRTILLCYAKDKEALKLKDKYYSLKEESRLSQHLQEDLIKETNSGIVVNDAKHLSKVLMDLYIEFTTNGIIHCNSINTEQFSRKIQVKKLAEIIFNITDQALKITK